MIHRHLLIDPEGWVWGTRVSEHRPPAIATGEGIPAVLGGMPTDPPEHHSEIVATHEDIHLAQTIPMLRWKRKTWGADGALELPQDDRMAWRLWRAYGLSGAEAHAALGRIREARKRITRDVSIAPKKQPQVQTWDGMPVGPIADVPGLALVPMTHEHLDDAANIAVDYNIYLPTCPPESTCGCQPPEAHAWLQLAQRMDNADSWQMALMFNGKPLQFELVNIVGTTATFSLTYHMNRERSKWFWREAEQPVFAALKAMGVKSIQSRTRADRPDWIQSLKDNYNAVETGEWDSKTKRLEYPLDMTIFKGWPARRTAGPGWTWSHAGSGLEIREMAAEDFDAVYADVAQTWGGEAHPAVPNVRRILHEQWHLDRATVLVAYRAGELVGVFSLRPRRQQVVHSAICSRYGDPEAHVMWRMMYRGVCEWAYSVGYTTLTGMIPQPVWDTPSFRRALRHARATVVAKRRYLADFIEVAHDLVAIHAEPESAWRTWNANRLDLPDMADIE